MSGSPRPTSEAFSIHPYTYLHDLTRGRRQLEVRRPLDSEACHSGVCPFFSLRYSSLINYLFLMSHTPLDRNIKVISPKFKLEPDVKPNPAGAPPDPERDHPLGARQ